MAARHSESKSANKKPHGVDRSIGGTRAQRALRDARLERCVMARRRLTAGRERTDGRNTLECARTGSGTTIRPGRGCARRGGRPRGGRARRGGTSRSRRRSRRTRGRGCGSRPGGEAGTGREARSGRSVRRAPSRRRTPPSPSLRPTHLPWQRPRPHPRRCPCPSPSVHMDAQRVPWPRWARMRIAGTTGPSCACCCPSRCAVAAWGSEI